MKFYNRLTQEERYYIFALKASNISIRQIAKQIHRAIPSFLRKHIWERDEGRCTYVHPQTKRKCSSKHLLQIDHIKPFSLGGKSEAGNLRLLCAGHNQYRSERTFRL